MYAQASIAVLALLAGNVAAKSQFQTRQFSNGTSLAPAVGTKLAVNGKLWQYDGCLGSQSQFSSFSLASNTAANTVESCLATCNTRFAGIYETSCYCANILDEASDVGSGVCDIPCPGAPAEVCGGKVAVSKRQTSNAILLSFYEQVSNVNIVPAVTTSAGPAPTAGQIVYVTYVNNYYDVCGCDSGLSLYSETTTLAYAHCGCATPSVPVPPMTTTTKLCNNCGPSGVPATVTLTLPCKATATGTAVYYEGICKGSGCPIIPSTATCVNPICYGLGCPTTEKIVCTGTGCPPTTCTGTGCPPTTCTGTGCPPVVVTPPTVCNGSGCPVTTTVTVSTCPATTPVVKTVTSVVGACNGSGCPAVSTPVIKTVTSVVGACNGSGCPGVSTAVVCNGAGCPGTSTATAAVVCNGVNCPGVAKPTTAVVVPCPTCTGGTAKYTGAASAQQVGGLLMAAGLAAALL